MQVAGLQMAGGAGPSCAAAQMPMLQAFRHIVQREGIKALWKVRQNHSHQAFMRPECSKSIPNGV